MSSSIRGALAWALAAVVVVGAVVVVAGRLGGAASTVPAFLATRLAAAETPSPAATGTGTAAGAGTPTAVPFDLSPWRTDAPAFTEALAFAPSAPLTGYACGRQDHTTIPSPVAFAATKDGGATWTPLAFTGSGYDCHLFVNPANAQEVILEVGECLYYSQGLCRDNGASNAIFARSTNGGHAWAVMAPPASFGLWYETSAVAWSGGRIYIGTTNSVIAGPAGSPYSVVAHDFTTQLGPDTEVSTFVAQGTTLYCVLASFSNRTLYAFAKSTDGGATWTDDAFMNSDGKLIELLAATPGGTLWGQTATAVGLISYTLELVTSADGGHSWQTVALPAPTDQFGAAIVAANGALFAALRHADGRQDVQRLASGGTQWTPVTPLYGGPPNGDPDTLATVSLNAQGQPARLWALAYTGQHNGYVVGAVYDLPLP